MLPVGGGGDKVPEFIKVLVTAGILELAVSGQEVFKQDKIEFTAGRKEFAQVLEDDAVGWDGKELGLEAGLLQELGLLDTGTEQCFLAIEVEW